MTHNFETLEHHMLGEVEEAKSDIEGIKNDVLELQDKNKANEERLHAVETKIEEAIKELKDQLSRIEAGIGNGGLVIRETPRLEIPKPKTFDGKRDAKEVENFLWDLEQYFDVMRIVEEPAKVRTATCYLADIATLWWRRKRADIEKGLCTIDSRKSLSANFIQRTWCMRHERS